MPSLIQGYEYDVFISYRQKDNKYDGWVTDFVANLRKELEATFKEDISIYFDENPHDGVLETHDVDDSLKGKLKCVVFIPIVSKTYCDPKSFAWKHEFEVFLRLISNDQIGLKVKLNNGNVASRILPVRIHDLEKDDIALFQSYTGSPMRAIDFVYKTSGVNRPMLRHESHPDENQNHISYRDQINKLANTIKEIISGVSRRNQVMSGVLEQNHSEIFDIALKSDPRPAIRKRRARLLAVLIFLALISCLVFYLNFARKNERNDAPGKSIAVLPFENLSGGQDQEYFSDGVAEEILIALAQIKDLKVAGRMSSFRFKGKDVDISEVGEKLQVSTVLEGSVRKQGSRVRISARLLNVEDGYQLWAEQFEGDLSDMFKIQEDIAVAISRRLRVTLLQSESLKMGNGLTTSTEAYDAMLKGRFFWEKRLLAESEKYFKQAIELDPNFAPAYAGLAETYVVSPIFRHGSPTETMPKAQNAAEKAIQLDSSLTVPYFVIALKKALFDWNGNEARAYFKKAFLENSNYAPGYYWHAQYLYYYESDFDGAVAEMRKAVKIEPLGAYAYLNLGNGLFFARKFKEAIEAYNFSIQLNNLNPLSYLGRGQCNIALEKWGEAQKDLEISASQNTDLAKALLVYCYLRNGNQVKAEKLYDELNSPTRAGYTSQSVVSMAASFLKKSDLAHEHLKKAVEERDNWLPYFINLPIRLPNDALSDPRNMSLMVEHFPFMKNQQ